MKRAIRFIVMSMVLALAGASVLFYWYAAHVRALRAAMPRPERTITLIEGKTLAEYGAYLADAHAVDSPEVWLRATGDIPLAAASSSAFAPRYVRIFPEVLGDKPMRASLEGYIFPDTYRIFKDAPPRQIIEKALSELDTQMTPVLRADIARAHHTVFETLTMASLVEAEGKTNADRRMIADILWRRLNASMPLQLDSTVNFITGAHTARASRRDILIDNPYNTYAHAGLPPGPINNPSAMSIQAAAYPSANEYWYFLSGNDGMMHYARTLREHERNIARYLP